MNDQSNGWMNGWMVGGPWVWSAIFVLGVILVIVVLNNQSKK